MSQQQIITILQAHQNILQLNDIIPFLLRQLGWLLVKGIYYLVSAIEGAVEVVFTLNGFWQTSEVQQFIQSFQPVFYALLVISILYLGYTFLVNDKQDRNKLLSNIFLSIVIIVGLSTLMVEVNKIASAAMNAIMPQTESITSSMISNSVTDVLLYDELDFKHPPTVKNKLTNDNILNINPTEIVFAKDATNSAIFDNIIDYDKDGNPTLKDVSQSWWNIWKSGYFRYSIDFLGIFVNLIVLGLVFGFVIFRVCKIYYELAIHQFLATVLAWVDWSSGARLRKVLETIFLSMFTLFYTVLLLKLFMIGTAYANTISNVFVKMIFLVMSGIVTISGPALVERILGMESGSKGITQKLAGMYYGMQTMTGIGRAGYTAGAGLIRAGKNMTASVVGAAAGTGKSIKDGINNTKNKASHTNTNNDTGSNSTFRSDKTQTDRTHSKGHVNSQHQTDMSQKDINNSKAKSNSTAKSAAQPQPTKKPGIAQKAAGKLKTTDAYTHYKNAKTSTNNAINNTARSIKNIPKLNSNFGNGSNRKDR